MPCCKALGSAMHTAESSFLKLKDRGYLFKPTTSMLTVCEETEKCFQRMLLSTGGTLPHCMGISDAIATSVLSGIDHCKVFRELDDHMRDTAVNDNHVYSLIKTILQTLLLQSQVIPFGKEVTAKLHGKKIRKKLSKLILFNNQ